MTYHQTARTLLLLSVASLCVAQPTSPGEVASYSINRGALGPDFSKAYGFVYYTYINGIDGSMFSGPPSEATAYFTFKTSVATTFPLPLHNDETLVVSSGALYDIYYDPSPSHNWNDPNSFARGTKVATFQRSGFILVGVGFAAHETFNSVLTFSQPFTFNGKTLDFKRITLGLRTSNIFGRFAFPSGQPDFPVFLSFSGTAVATRLPPPLGATSAIASPKNATVVTRQIQLDGSKSTSSDGLPLKYLWTIPPGKPSAGISQGDTATPTVQFGTIRGAYQFQLTVTDSSGASATDIVTVNYLGS